MKKLNLTFAIFILLSIFGVAYASVSVGMPQNAVCGNSICEPDAGENYANCNKDCLKQPLIGYSGFDLGMPTGSFADPEYVGQQKMVESMTTAYNWIALNSAKFASGCKDDKDSLVNDLVSVIQQAQETSQVCTRLQKEADSCSPELFCSRFSSGKLPLPPEAISVLKMLGYDPNNMKIEDITEELMQKVCVAQMNPQLEQRKQMLENAKSQIKEQLPAFRAKCDEFMKQKQGGMYVRLPDLGNFNVRPVVQQNYNPQQVAQGQQQTGPQQGYGCREENKKQCGQNERLECINGVWNCIGMPQPQGNFCQGEPPSCPDVAGGAFCDNGNWICPQGPEPQQQQAQQVNQIGQAPVQEPQQTTEQQPQGPETQQPATTETTNETSSSESVEEANPQEATVSPGILDVITGFISGITASFEGEETLVAVCGDGKCDWGEEGICTKDCKVQTQQTSAATNSGGYGGYGGIPNPIGINSICGNGICEGDEALSCQNDCGGMSNGSQHYYGSQQQESFRAPQQGAEGPGFGPNPEILCGMSDEEIIEAYTQNIDMGLSKEEIEYQCRNNSSKMLAEMNRYKLEIAMCRADAALDCESKQQAVANCNELKENPTEVAKLIVNNMCRRFVKPSATGTGNKLYEIASKWYSEDPALANQLGDTVDKTLEDRQKLNILSYIIGDGKYAENLKKRAEKLEAVKERLVSKGVEDQETIAAIDEQAKALEEEGNKFGNALDITRLGYLFGRQ